MLYKTDINEKLCNWGTYESCLKQTKKMQANVSLRIGSLKSSKRACSQARQMSMGNGYKHNYYN